MDEIQKVLVKAGRKDLAQKYYEKVAAKPIKSDPLSKVKELISKVDLKNVKSINVPQNNKILEEFCEQEINSPMTVLTDSNGLVLQTMRGSSLRQDIKDAFRTSGLDRIFDTNAITMEDDGEEHQYNIPYIGKGIKSDEWTEKTFIEDVVDQAADTAEEWMGSYEDNVDDEDGDGDSSGSISKDSIEGGIDDFPEYYSGEFMEKWFSKNKNKIVNLLYKKFK